MNQDHQVINEVFNWGDRVMWSIIALFLMGSIARTFISNEPFDCKKFFGELIFSAIGAVIMFSLGLMQGMSEVQIVCMGSMASLGGVRTIEWVIKATNQLKVVNQQVG